MRLRRTLKVWNWNIFGNLSQKKNELQEKIQRLETQLQLGWDEGVHGDWDTSRRELSQVETWENELLCHQARMEWTKDGDRNSKFYHAVIKERRKRQIIQLTSPNGELTTEPNEIGAMAKEFLSDLFAASPYYMDNQLFASVQPSISQAEDQEFSSFPTSEEVWEAIQQMNPASSPGNDGFTGYFSRACWDILQGDLCHFIMDFFTGKSQGGDNSLKE